LHVLALRRSFAGADLARVRAGAGGAGGLICSCTNLTQDTIVVTFLLIDSGGFFACNGETLASGGSASCDIASSALPRLCKVRRDDGAPAKTRQLACSIAALDAAGNPTVVVPVNRIFKQ
jgi:hypothetical protein